jgi:voltage-gated potassium channel
MENQRSRELRTSSYELFIGALSVLSIINLVLLLLPISDQVKQLILIIDVALTAIFLIDFAVRFVSAPVKSRYFFRGGGWLDLIGSLPALRIFRLFRVVRVGRLLRRYGLRNVFRELVYLSRPSGRVGHDAYRHCTHWDIHRLPRQHLPYAATCSHS